SFSVEMYNQRASQYANEKNIKVTTLDQFYKEEKFIQYWVDSVNTQLNLIPEEAHQKTAIIVSAHSLPEKILEHNDPYPSQLEETAQLLKEQANLQNVFVGWQSEGNTPEPWLGPDVQDQTRDLYEEHGFKHLIYLPLGFV